MRLFIVVFLSISLLYDLPLYGQDSVKIVSFNIRLSSVDDGPNHWQLRRGMLQEYINSSQADIIGVQEAMPDQVAYMDSIPDYEYVGVGRENGLTQGEHCAIFYNSTSIKLLQSGTFWLSETPKEPSMGWDAACKRICTWAKFKKGNIEFFVYNTHLDHIGTKARKEGARLLVAKISLVSPEYPLFLIGDFNAKPDDFPISILTDFLVDSRTLALVPDYSNGLTYTGFKKPESRIDYIFVRPGMLIDHFNTNQTMPGGRFISDHFPVEVNARLNWLK